MKIQGLGEYVTVEPLKNQSENTVHGLTIPKSQNKIVSKGIVKSIGDGKHIQRMNLKVGDMIFYQDIERDLWFDEENPNGIYFIRHDMIFGKAT